jgi:uncharacterized protein DUF547
VRPRIALSGWTAALVLVWSGFAEAQIWGPPKPNLWPRWEQQSPSDTRSIEHGAWDTFLRKYLDTGHPSGIHRMNYKAVTADDRRALEGYLGRLQSTPVSGYNRREQQAYWINLYNALTVKVILDHYPVKSIRSIKPNFLTSGPWDLKLVTVEGERLSLNDIEHRILRPIWKDPRLHYAVNCASLGCPNLAGVAYASENLDRLLTEGAVAYVNHPRGASFRNGRLRVSSIYEWFQDDFGGSAMQVLEHLRRYARGELAERLKGYDGRLEDDYSWELNEP